MKNLQRRFAWVGMAILSLLLGLFPGLAFAQDMAPMHGTTPIRSVNFQELDRCPKDANASEGQKCLRIKNKDIDTVGLANLYGTSTDQIRKDNPLRTVALCKNARGKWIRGSVRTIEDRASNDVWIGCAERYTYVPPYELLVISPKKSASFDEDATGLNALRACDPANNDCLQNGLKRLGITTDALKKKPTDEKLPPMIGGTGEAGSLDPLQSQDGDTESTKAVQTTIHHQRIAIGILATALIVLLIALLSVHRSATKRSQRIMRLVALADTRLDAIQAKEREIVQYQELSKRVHEAYQRDLKADADEIARLKLALENQSKEVDHVRRENGTSHERTVRNLMSEQLQRLHELARLFGIGKIQTESPDLLFTTIYELLRLRSQEFDKLIRNLCAVVFGEKIEGLKLRFGLTQLQRIAEGMREVQSRLIRMLELTEREDEGNPVQSASIFDTLEQRIALLMSEHKRQLPYLRNQRGNRTSTEPGLHPIPCGNALNIGLCIRRMLDKVQGESQQPLLPDDAGLLLHLHRVFGVKRTYKIKIGEELLDVSSSRDDWDASTEAVLGALILPSMEFSTCH
ncbi:MAG: hypothetical protein WC477_05395 [Patescibacteria group bacterium]